MLTLSNFQEFYDNELCALPVIWDTNKQVSKHPNRDGIPSMQHVEQLLLNDFSNANGIAIQLFPPFGMFDFDLKNTDEKNIYNNWLQIINTQNPEILKKVVIETTRNAGYHVYIKYSELNRKKPLATSAGKEVISVYTGGLLAYCAPSPGYNLIHNDWADLAELTATEFDVMVSAAAYFNEDIEYEPGASKIQVIEYPVEDENTCLQFDSKISNETFEALLNSITLYRVKDQRLYKKKNWVAFLRNGSEAAYSAKVYFKSKRVLLFSASMGSQFPTWENYTPDGNYKWSLSPTKIVYYKNNCNWDATIEEIKMICDSAGIEIIESKPIPTNMNIQDDRLIFPYEIFPDSIKKYIDRQVIQHEYLAGGILVALAACIGNSVVLKAMDGYIVKCILFMAIVAPPGASKTPALKIAFAPLEDYDNELYDRYLLELKKYEEKIAKQKAGKKDEETHKKPTFPQILIKDSTIEMVIKILSINKLGCCVSVDELSGFFSRMNQYKSNGDEVQKWLELWSGNTILLQRITREENKVKDTCCCLIGGIQDGILNIISKGDNEHNGFIHRLLYVYPEPQNKMGWEQINISEQVKAEYKALFTLLLVLRDSEKKIYELCPEANTIYKEWYDAKNMKYNKSSNNHIKGIIAKYQDYCLRFALILQVAHDAENRTGIITKQCLEHAIRLTEYFFANMNKALKILVPDSPVDKLQKPWDEFYQKLSEYFTISTAIKIGTDLGIKKDSVKTFIYRNAEKKELFEKLYERGRFQKLY